MPKYRVLEKSFLDNNLRNEGDIVDYDGVPGKNLEAIDAPAKDAKGDAVTANTDSLARQHVAAAGGNPDDPEAVALINAATIAAAAKPADTKAADSLV